MRISVLSVCSLLVGLAIATSAVTTFSNQVRAPRQDYTSGPYLYRVFCASCHGETGKGNGPVSELLRRQPSDLTTISERRGGTYPRAEVFAAIDGRRRLPGHGSTDMPVWGDVLRITEGQDDAIIKKRIAALVTHIESIQSVHPGVDR